MYSLSPCTLPGCILWGQISKKKNKHPRYGWLNRIMMPASLPYIMRPMLGDPFHRLVRRSSPKHRNENLNLEDFGRTWGVFDLVPSAHNFSKNWKTTSKNKLLVHPRWKSASTSAERQWKREPSDRDHVTKASENQLSESGVPTSRNSDPCTNQSDRWFQRCNIEIIKPLVSKLTFRYPVLKKWESKYSFVNIYNIYKKI